MKMHCSVFNVICLSGVNKLGCQLLAVYAGFRLNTNKKLTPKVNAYTDTETHFVSQVLTKCGVLLLFRYFFCSDLFVTKIQEDLCSHIALDIPAIIFMSSQTFSNP